MLTDTQNFITLYLKKHENILLYTFLSLVVKHSMSSTMTYTHLSIILKAHHSYYGSNLNGKRIKIYSILVVTSNG